MIWTNSRMISTATGDVGDNDARVASLQYIYLFWILCSLIFIEMKHDAKDIRLIDLPVREEKVIS